MEEEFRSVGARMISGGTDNHMLLIDAVTSWGATGGEAEKALDEVHITLNKMPLLMIHVLLWILLEFDWERQQ